MNDLPPELRDDAGPSHRPVQPTWWRATAAVIALVLIAMLIVAYVL